MQSYFPNGTVTAKPYAGAMQIPPEYSSPPASPSSPSWQRKHPGEDQPTAAGMIALGIERTIGGKCPARRTGPRN